MPLLMAEFCAAWSTIYNLSRIVLCLHLSAMHWSICLSVMSTGFTVSAHPAAINIFKSWFSFESQREVELYVFQDVLLFNYLLLIQLPSELARDKLAS